MCSCYFRQMAPGDSIIALYERHAASFDTQRGRDLIERSWLERFAAAIRPGGTILDLGCGMGEPIAAFLIGRGFAITGIDGAPSLVAMAESRFPDQSWIVGDIRTVTLEQRFDGIIAWHSLFHLTADDQRTMIRRFYHWAAQGAPLLFTTGTALGETIGEWEGEPLYHASLAPEEYRALLEANSFSVEAFAAKDRACGDATVWLAAHRPHAGEQ